MSNGRKTTSLKQGRDREVGSEGSWRQSCEPTNRNGIQGQAPGASQHMMTKPGDSRGMVNAAAVQRRFTFLSGETCPTSGSQDNGSRTEAHPERDGEATGPYRQADSAGRSNPPRDGAGVSRGHSTAGALAGRPELEGRERPRRDSTTAQTPPGGAGGGRSADSSEPYGDDLLERMLDRENMLRAWKRVKANKGCAGVDGMTIEDFPAFARQNWEAIRRRVLQGTYQPSPVLRVEIPKDTGGKRPLGIPVIVDRVLEQSLAQVREPIFEPIFSSSSYGFRPRRSAHDAVRAVRQYVRDGYRIAVDADLAKFFDRVSHDVLLHLLARRVRDKRILKLIGRYLRAGVSVDGRIEPTVQGVPQGGPVSPLLANVVLHELDCELEGRGLRFARYADDFIILVKSPRSGERVFASVSRFLERTLKLTVNAAKSKVAPVQECRFLGFCIVRGGIRWTPETEREFKRRIRRLTGRSWGVSMDYRMRKLAGYMRGWIGYFGLSEYYSPIPGLDEWIRRRLRLCFWKMWRRTRTRIRELLRLGTHLNVALSAASSAKSYWRWSRTLATQTGLTNAWLKSQGLLSLKEQWVAIHYPDQSG